MVCVTAAVLSGMFYASPEEMTQVREFTPWVELVARRMSAHEGGVSTVAFDAAGERLGSSGYDQKVRIWQIAGARLVQTIDVDRPEVHLSPDLTRVAWAPLAIQQIDISKAPMRRMFGGAQVLAYSADGAFLVSGEAAGFVRSPIRIFQADDGRLVRNLEGHPASIAGLAFRPDGRLLASSGRDGTIRLWSVADGKLVESRNSAYGPLAFSPDGRLLALGGSQAGPLAIWDVPEMTLKHERHTDGVVDLAFSPDEELLAVCFWSDYSSAPGLQLVRVADGEVLQTLIRGVLSATCVEFSPKGELLAVGLSDGTIRFFAPGKE